MFFLLVLTDNCQGLEIRSCDFECLIVNCYWIWYVGGGYQGGDRGGRGGGGRGGGRSGSGREGDWPCPKPG